MPLLRKDYGKREYLVGAEDLGDIVLPAQAPEGSSLRVAPGRGKIVRRLRLDQEIARVAAREIAPLVEQLTGFSDLLRGVRFEIVDDFEMHYLTRVARVGNHAPETIEDRARIAYHARTCELDMCAMWQSERNVIVLNGPLLEYQGLDFLKVPIGHELVHVGQTRTYPEIGARLRAAVEEAYKEIFVGVAQDPEREKEAILFSRTARATRMTSRRCTSGRSTRTRSASSA